MEQLERMRIAAAARRRAERFSDQRFQAEFLDCMLPLLPPVAVGGAQGGAAGGTGGSTAAAGS